MSDTPATPNARRETDVEKHLRYADEYGGDAAMHVQNAIRHCQDSNQMGANIELTDAAVAVFRGQVELARAAEAGSRVRQ